MPIKWEYQAARYKVPVADDGHFMTVAEHDSLVQIWLDEWGAHGWELIAPPHFAGLEFTALLKRKWVKEPTQRRWRLADD
jgi:hypothetical protein